MAISSKNRGDASEIDRICRQSIQKYLDLKGIPYKYDDRNFIRLRDHDSLVIDIRSTSKKPYETFYWNSQGVGGNLYNFIKYYEGVEKSRDIMKILRNMSPELAHAKKHYAPIVHYDPKRWQGVADHRQVTNYLVNQRKLDPNLVGALFKANLIRQLPNGNAYFVWRDTKGKEIGGDQQGTMIDHQHFGKRGTLKMIGKGSEPKAGFSFQKQNADNPSEFKKLYVFESPVDALSHFNMNHNTKENMRYLSLNGAGSKLKTVDQFMLERGDVGEVHLCLDTDEAGAKGVLKYVRDHQTKGDVHDRLVNYLTHSIADSPEKPQFIAEAKSEYSSFNRINDKYTRVFVDVPAAGNKDWNEALQKGEMKIQSMTPMEYVDRLKEKLGPKQFKEMVKEVKQGNLAGKPKTKTQAKPAPTQIKARAR